MFDFIRLITSHCGWNWGNVSQSQLSVGAIKVILTLCEQKCVNGSSHNLSGECRLVYFSYTGIDKCNYSIYTFFFNL